jgi:pimeloyl-ACP methyl ester carboxylesterase
MTTYETAVDQYVTVNGLKYAYRLFGNKDTSSPPLFMHIHFRGNMDWWDPALINPLAAQRQILLIDNTGVGRSEGEVPTNFRQWARDIISVVKALDIPVLDSFGFSMGGFVSHMIALEAPELVRKVIVAGSGPSQGEGTLVGDGQYVAEIASGVTEEDHHKAMLHTFFSWSNKKQALGEQWWQRMTKARPDREPLLAGQGMQNQIASVIRWNSGEHREEASYDRLHEIKKPVLVANGSNDLLVPTHNSYILWKQLVNADAQLHLYADSSHGFLDEYHEEFSRLVNEFLDSA